MFEIENTKHINYANRGMVLEEMVNYTNKRYRNRKLALITKAPTPWKVLFKKGTNIPVKAFVEEKAFLDYFGVAYGKAITFDAKSTREVTRFPLSNVKPHQVELMKDWEESKGIAFLLIYFERFDETYLLPYSILEEYWIASMNGGRKSIPYKDISERCEKVKATNRGIVDYLKIIEKRENINEV